MPRGRAAHDASVETGPPNAGCGVTLQDEGSSAVGPEKVGQKRRAALQCLQEVQANQRRRSSRETSAKDASAYPAGAKKVIGLTDRQLRLQNREKARQTSSKQASKAPAFEIYHDHIPASDAVKPSGGGLSHSKQPEVQPNDQEMPKQHSEPPAAAEGPLLSRDNEEMGDGGWEVLPVQQNQGQTRGSEHPSPSADSGHDGTRKQEQVLEMEKRSAQNGEHEMVPSVASAKLKTEPVADEKEEDMAEEIVMEVVIEKSAGAQPQMDSSRTIEEKLKQSEIGKEMLEGEEAVSIVTDAIKGTAGRWAPVPVPAASASDSDPPAFDIDSRDRMDEFGVTEYTKEIYAFLRANERRSLVDHTYMARQGDINAKMRVILNDWLVEVHLKFKLRQETLYLCFQLIDRFLETNDVKRQKLQLVGVTGLMLASKYEEIYPPEVRDYVYICDNAYTREEILGMEQTMLAKLEYRLSLPTVWCFMKRFCKAAGRQIQRPDSFFFLVSYLVELAMIQIRMLRFVPSELVAASIYLSNMLREDGDCWTEQLQHHTGYSVTDLECCVGELRSLLREAPKETKYKAVYKKFCHRSYESVAVEYADRSGAADTTQAANDVGAQTSSEAGPR